MSASLEVILVEQVLERSVVGVPGAGLPADGDNSGTVDQGDYTVWKANFGKPGPGAAAGTAAVPEPATLGLVSFCVLCLAARRRSA